MVRRTRATSFFGGAYVFPGGRVDAADRLADESWCDGIEALHAKFPDLAREEATGYATAAARELFEEAGVLLARGADGQIVRTDDAAAQARYDAHRHAIHCGERTLRDVLAAERLRLALDRFVPFAHWITPVNEPKRFDTRFFLARMPAGQRPMHDAGETTDSLWIGAAEALERFRRDEIVLAPPTWGTLRDLARFATVEETVAWGARARMTAIQPRPYEEAGRRMLLLPGDPLNPEPCRGEPPDETRFVLDSTGRWRAGRADAI
jgi:8-oxo-dGTP pyrophosphatase MutT (NUDIX family)